MTTGLENKQVIEDAASHARLGVCPKTAWELVLFYDEGWFDEREIGWLKYLHWEWLKRNPEVECSCR